MRSCEEFEKLLPAYVAGVADPADVEDIGEHLAECGPCMNDFQRIVKDLGALKAMRDALVPEGLSARILERLAAVEETRRRETSGEETSLAEPIQRALQWGVLAVAGIVVLAMVFTAQSGVRYYESRRDCTHNLHRIGVAASAASVASAPLERNRDVWQKFLDPAALRCPLAAPDESSNDSSYLLDLAGPTYVAGDRWSNHSGDPRHMTWGTDANILMSDGSVITATPAQGQLWDLLDNTSPGR